jgi:methyl-accepting chemotaxis protein
MVVSNNIKELARQAGEYTNLIEGKLETISHDSKSAVSKIEEMHNVVFEVGDVIKNLITAFQEVIDGQGEIIEKDEEFQTNMKRLDEKGGEIDADMDEVLKNNKEMASSVEEMLVSIKRVSEIFKENIKDIEKIEIRVKKPLSAQVEVFFITKA